MYAQQKDGNADELREFVESNKCFIITRDRRDGHDWTVYAPGGREFTVEIKDGSLPPSRRRLTENEQRTKDKIEALGGTYWILESIADAAKMLGVPEPLRLF